ncbi:MAG TPA: guanylate kinase [Armatimonadota bacterium]|nr:guanylate kinase [Armatimonadota bacterium]
MQPATNFRPRGTLFVLSGPSGVGKNTVLRRAAERVRNLQISVSVTTRAPRRGERPDVSYVYVSPDAFAGMRDAGAFLEYAEVHDASYGTRAAPVRAWLDAGQDVVLEIDVQGALQVRAHEPDLVLVFLAPPSWEELATRLRRRDTETEEKIARRLAHARREMARIGEYHYLIINDQLADAVERFCAIVTAERCRPARQDLRGLLGEHRDG